MAGTRDKRFWLRTSLVLGAVAVALVALLGGTIWFILDDQGLAPPPRAAAQRVERVVRTHAAGPGVDEAGQGQGQLTLRVVTTSGEPVAGMTLALDPETGTAPLQTTTDAGGRAALYDISAAQRWVVRSDPEWQVQTPYSLRSTEGDTVQTIIVARTCGGPVRVLAQDGMPFVGRLRWSSGLQGRWLDLDETGTVDVESRPCGRIHVRVIDPRGQAERRSFSFDGEVEGDELVEFQVGPIRAAVVQLVDEDGAPIDASFGSQTRSFERLGIGRFRVEGRRETYRFSISQSDNIRQHLSVPLDGGVHERVLPRPREVAVTLLCDDCPDLLFCGTTIHSYGGCTGAAPDFICTCPAEESILASVSTTALGSNRQGPHPLATVHPAESEKTVEVRGGRAALEATWTGDVPCTATLAFRDLSTPMNAACGIDGNVFASDLFPGTWTLSISDGFGVKLRQTVVLESHEHRDLGEIGPTGLDTGR